MNILTQITDDVEMQDKLLAALSHSHGAKYDNDNNREVLISKYIQEFLEDSMDAYEEHQKHEQARRERKERRSIDVGRGILLNRISRSGAGITPPPEPYQTRNEDKPPLEQLP